MHLLFQIPDLLTPLVESGRPWLARYGLWTVAVGLFTETLLFTGVVIPGFAILVGAGYLVAAGALPAIPTLALAWLGALLGDQASYLLGYWFGHRLLRRKAGFRDRMRRTLEQEGPFLLLLYHYAPALRSSLPCVAGSTRYNIRTWLMFDSLGVLVWVALILALGYAAEGMLHDQGNIVAQAINLLATLLMACVMWRVYRRVSRVADPEAQQEDTYAQR